MLQGLIGRLRFSSALLCVLAWPCIALSDEAKVVSVAPLSQVTSYSTRSYPATVIALNRARVSARINAQLLSIEVRTGDIAEAGSVLARLDCDLINLDADIARAARDQAAEDLQRVQKLRETQVVSAQQFTAASVASRSSRAQYEQARLLQQYCAVKAPYTGVITQRIASVGDFLAAGMPVVEIVQIDGAEIQAMLPFDVAADITVGFDAVFETGDDNHQVTARAVVPVIDPATRQQELRFTSDTRLPPGTVGRLTWQSSNPVINADIVQSRDGQFGIFILDNDRAKFHPVQNAIAGKPVSVGLPDSTKVITTGRYNLQDGDQVEVR